MYLFIEWIVYQIFVGFQMPEKLFHPVDLDGISRIPELTEAKRAKSALYAGIGGALHVGPAVADHPVMGREAVSAHEGSALPEGQSRRLHLGTVAAGDNRPLEVAHQAEMLENGASRERRLRGVDAEKPTAGSELVQRLADRRVKLDRLEHVFGVVASEYLPKPLHVIGLFGNRMRKKVFRSLSDMA